MHGSRVNTIDACLLAWCCGIMSPLMLTNLPGGGVLWVLGAGGLVLVIGGRAVAPIACGWLLLGLCYGGLSGHQALQHRLPECADGTDVQLVGKIQTLSRAADLMRFEVAIDDA